MQDDRVRLEAIGRAARTVGESLDWVDHGGGERAWALIREQPLAARRAYDALSASVRALVSEELVRQFERAPEQYWGRLQDRALAAVDAAFVLD